MKRKTKFKQAALILLLLTLLLLSGKHKTVKKKPVKALDEPIRTSSSEDHHVAQGHGAIALHLPQATPSVQELLSAIPSRKYWEAAFLFSDAAYIHDDGASLKAGYEAFGFDRAFIFKTWSWQRNLPHCAFAYTEHSERDYTVAVTIRGSDGLGDWARNMETIMAYDPNIDLPDDRPTTAHWGFASAAASIHAEVEDYIRKQDFPEDSRLRFFLTGHSQGAAVAGLLAARLHDETKIPASNLLCITFASPNYLHLGSPFFGDKTNYAHQYLSEHYSFINNLRSSYDLVCQVPPDMLFDRCTLGRDLWGDFTMQEYPADFIGNHDLENYRNFYRQILTASELRIHEENDGSFTISFPQESASYRSSRIADLTPALATD